jgi:hypothetical protein
MKFNKDYIGKVCKIGEKKLVITNYDFLHGKYLAVNIFALYKTFEIADERLNDFISTDKMLKEYKQEILFLREVFYIIQEKQKDILYHTCSSSREEFDKIFRRIHDCNQNILNYEYLIKHVGNDKSKELYRKELNNAKKGFRRALKRLYSYFDEEEYYTLMEYLKETNYFLSPSDVEYRLNNVIKESEEFIKVINKLKENLKKGEVYG